MTTTTIEKTATPNGLDARVLARVLEEGYGPGAWHGPDLRAALADVGPEGEVRYRFADFEAEAEALEEEREAASENEARLGKIVFTSEN